MAYQGRYMYMGRNASTEHPHGQRRPGEAAGILWHQDLG